MADNPDKGLPRAAVVLHTADGERIKPPCPMCSRTYWGRLVPPGYKKGDEIAYKIQADMHDSQFMLGVQLWVCMNCGFLWHRTGSVDKTPVRHED